MGKAEGLESTIARTNVGSLPLAAPDLRKWSGKRRKQADLMIKAALDGASADLAPYLEAGDAWLEAASVELASMAGGQLGPIGHAIATTAAIQLAWCRYFFHIEGRRKMDPPDPKAVEMASRLGDAARLNMTAAYELAIRIGKASGGSVADPLDSVTVPASAAHVSPPEEMPEL